MKNSCLMLAVFVLLSLSGFPQEKITGVITDSKGKPAKGIKVQLMGKVRMATTSSQGAFELKDVNQGDTILVYPDRKNVAYVPVLGIVEYTFSLHDKYLSFGYGSDTVICMYGPIKKPSYNSNKITLEQIQQIGASTLIDVLRNCNIAGLQIDYGDSGAKATIRGASSFSLNTEPLFVVNGSEYTSLESASQAIAVDNIFEIEVKKDGSEYGMKGSNGVIIVRTKRN